MTRQNLLAAPAFRYLELRNLALLALIASGLTFSGWIVAQDSGNGNGTRPLDLPSGGIGDDEDDEDAPELIVFYGSEYEGDGFFWCLDKSCSMSWNGGQPISTLKQEMTQAIQSLSNRAQISMVAFNQNFETWSQIPVTANTGNKASAISWVQGLVASGQTCITDAAVQTLQIANLCNREHKRMILVGDGVPECPSPNTPEQNEQTLNGITAANWQSIPVDTIFISASTTGIALFQAIANANNGTFTNPQ